MLRRLVLLVKFIIQVFIEVIIANIRVAYDVLTPKLRAHPALIDYPLSVKSDVEITWLANVISLTPGTLVLDVSDDKKHLLIHVMFMDDHQAVLDDIHQKFEQPIMEIFG